jgi:hypothetical protein
MKFIKLLTCSIALLILIACGGGGGSSTSSNAVQTGSFVDSPVSGLTYATATQSGVTDAAGSFKYVTGETVSFKLYGQQISAAAGYSTLTPYDTNDTTLSSDYSINLIRFFMALDTDANASNGITLPTFTGNFNINFNQDLFAFQTDAAVSSFLTTYAGGRSLATVQNAITHFMGSVASANDSYVFNLNGKTATSTATDSYCTNNLVQGWSYTFGPTSVAMVGDDSFNTNNNTICTASGSQSLTVAYSSIATGDFLDCAPSCSYAQLNRVTYVPSDPDGRAAIVWTWHTPNTKVITSIKRVIADPAHPNQPAALMTFKEVLTFN